MCVLYVFFFVCEVLWLLLVFGQKKQNYTLYPFSQKTLCTAKPPNLQKENVVTLQVSLEKKKNEKKKKLKRQRKKKVLKSKKPFFDDGLTLGLF